jgi:hypothetical protein
MSLGRQGNNAGQSSCVLGVTSEDMREETVQRGQSAVASGHLVVPITFQFNLLGTQRYLRTTPDTLAAASRRVRRSLGFNLATP